MLTAAILAGLPHGFSTREELRYDEVIRGAPLVLARQVHSAVAIIADAPWQGPPPEADAVVTKTRGLLVGVVTADCAPVLLADSEAGVVAAAHAGWRGAVGGVLENTLTAMETLGARRASIRTAIGPTIAQASYEVDAAMRDEFPADAHRFFDPGREGHWHFDLPGFAAARLAAAGVRHVEILGEDTYARGDRFFSYRRATHRGEATGGRQTSVIGIA